MTDATRPATRHGYGGTDRGEMAAYLAFGKMAVEAFIDSGELRPDVIGTARKEPAGGGQTGQDG